MKGCINRPDDVKVLKPQLKNLLLLNFIPHIDEPLQEKQHLLNVLKLYKNDILVKNPDGLQVGHNFYHKVFVVRVLLGVEISPYVPLVDILILVHLVEGEI